MSRPSVDVVVPFRGSAEDRAELGQRLARLVRRQGDSVTIVDNTPRQERTEPRERVLPGASDGVAVLVGPGLRVPAAARNRGAALGKGDWILFLDDDVEPPEDLLDRYFEPAPADRTALLAGGVQDEPVPPDARPVARYAYIRAATSQDDTFRFGDWGFPKTANVAVRRSALEAVGGFTLGVRAGEDSDLTYRLRGAGWDVERREDAGVIHRSRQTLRSFVIQKATHGSGGAWIDRRYPGASPPRRRLGLLWWGLRTLVGGIAVAIRSGDRDRAVWAVFEPIEAIVYEFGRSLPNERPLTLGAWWRAAKLLRRPR
jgi:glycosyltransferase involved in cell wall biosynthesis